VLCTGNICRSPMAEAFLRRRLADLGVEARVHSAGRLFADVPATAEAVVAMRELGYDTSDHRSRRLTPEMARTADLVVGMAREHVRDVAVIGQDVWPRAFTLKELVRRGAQVGPRGPGQPFDEWLAKAHAGRTTADILGASADDDVADPIGENAAFYRRTAAEIEALTDELVDLAWRRASAGGERT
jgi:protein-tyrosine-phosphatase